MVHQANEQEDNCFDLPWLQLHIGLRINQESVLVVLVLMRF